MVWQQVVLVALFVFSTGVAMSMIDRPRHPLTGGAFCFSIVVTAVMIALVVTI